MRRRITVAILVVVIGTLVLTVVGSLFLVRRAAFQTTDNEITTEAEAIGTIIAAQPKFAGAHQLDALRRIGAFDRLRLIRLSALDVTARIPAPLSTQVLNVPALDAGQTVAGNVGDVVFVARPVVVPGGIAGRLGEDFVLVATRQVSNPVNGIGYFVLVAGVVLIAGIVVAAVLARRLSAPITRAVEATRQIAGGNLAATVPVHRNESAELAALAEAINTLGANLHRAQGLEREFFLSVSHELRTPLTSIRGYADAVADGATDDVSGAIGIISSEARRLERLVQDLLDLARLQARQFSLHPQRVDGAAVVRASVEGFQPGARAQGITLTAAAPDGPGPWVDTDPDRLSQVVANLVENALKFATARVEIGVRRVADWVAVWVSDDGGGVAADDLAHIFERHFTSDRAARQQSGSGLGLAIVAELASAMGGSVDAQSPLTDDGGTRMVLWLRAAPGGGGSGGEGSSVPGPAPGPGSDPGSGPDGPTSALPLHPPV